MKQHLNLTPRKKRHLPSAQEVGHPSLHPPQGQDGEEANRELDKASSRVEKKFEGELEIAMDAEEKSFNMVAEEPTGFYFQFALFRARLLFPLCSSENFDTELQCSLLRCAQYQDTGQRYSQNNSTGKRSWNKSGQVCKW